MNPAVLGVSGFLTLASAVVAAAPVTYTYRADNAAGSLAGTAFGPGAVVVITIVADTSAVAAATVLGSPGTCVPSTSGTVSADGGTTTTALTGTAYVCTQPDGFGAGIYNAAGGNAYLVMSQAAWTGVGDLTIGFGPIPPTTANALTSHGSSYTLNVTGGTF